jgi:hypothetical protein
VLQHLIVKPTPCCFSGGTLPLNTVHIEPPNCGWR